MSPLPFLRLRLFNCLEIIALFFKKLFWMLHAFIVKPARWNPRFFFPSLFVSSLIVSWLGEWMSFCLHCWALLIWSIYSGKRAKDSTENTPSVMNRNVKTSYSEAPCFCQWGVLLKNPILVELAGAWKKGNGW